ncbi:MBL fold metallo-hydrolase [Alkalihalobacillus sp. CinArs1]|uniref:MBL fold metallo-hydrolase n=1 Tax=Alkalihalobacillus sp. CinArs1 TaxID=2995314 RepID=UPI0022DE7AC7|nr:MBL fold metallo-hydrolase [Alkalihalobacillus sp. CinArs1]
MSVYLYMVDQLLIDTGPARLHDELKQYIEKQPIDKIILTHHHEDHTGNAHLFSKGIPTYIHSTGIQYCEQKPSLPFYRKMFWGNRKAFTPTILGDEIHSEHHAFDVIHTPGHAPDHVVLLEREKGLLFSGDLYVMSRPKSIFAFESIPGIIDSIENVLTYDFSTMFCSHSGYIPNGRNRLEEKLTYLKTVQHDVLRKYQEGKSASEIQKELFPSAHALNYFSLFENSPKHIVTSIIKDSAQTV